MPVTTRQEDAGSARAGAQEGRGQRQTQQRQAHAQAQVQARAQAGQRRSTRSTLSHSALADSTAKHVTLTNTATTAATAAKNQQQHTMRVQHPHSARMKHPLDPITTNPDLPRAKRAKTSAFVIEIRSKPQPISPPKPLVVSAVRATTQQHNNAPPPLPPPPAAAAQPAKQAKTAQNQLTNHQKKVINGIRHELDRLQTGTADAPPPKDQGRKLRSQEATRFKSDLAHYFPDYDEVIGNEAKEHHILNIDTPILVVDSDGAPHHNVRTLPPRHATTATANTTHPSQSAHAVDDHSTRLARSHTSDLSAYPVKSYGQRLFTDLYQAQRLPDLAAGVQAGQDDAQDDPLPDSHYEQPHRKAERLEKTYRNTEKGRAQHEKDQIIRLLGELQGPDWLRTMGVSGVTESKKKTFEPARDHFVKGCQAILDKFRWWSQEEKRRKLERDRALAEEAASAEQELDDDEEEEEDGEDEEAGDGTVESEDEDEEMFDVDSADNMADDQSDGDPPDSSDVDASIAKQLAEEARLARTKFAPSDPSKQSRGEPPPELSPEPEPAREFKSFFEKRYERDAALNKVRRSRRPVLAWGHPVPEMDDEDFELSEEFLDEETMQARERRKRRDRRGNRR